MSVYYIHTATESIRVEVDDPPPCLWCDRPVTHPSTDGPLVCPACDSGVNPDGSKWTAFQYDVRIRHFHANVERYRAAAADVHSEAK